MINNFDGMKIKKWYLQSNMAGKWMLLFLLLSFNGVAWSQTSRASSSEKMISGVVVDENGDALIGVSVVEKGTRQGIITDFDGRFKLEVLSLPAMLQFSYLGFQTKEVLVEGRGELNVVLQEAVEMLDELVVVAYGTQRKKDLTGAVGIVNTENMKKLLTPNLADALQGQAAGVTVTTSGAPGSTPDIRIRGIGSFSNKITPLYVVDGMILEGPQREFNVNDVESMQILKDAAATALYGSRGANGIIIITTKKGKVGPNKIDFSANYGVQQIANRIEMMNSLEFLKLNRLAYQNADKEWPGEPAQGQVLTNTDWQDEFMKTGFTQDYNLSLSGGSKNGNYMLSFNYFTQDGVVEGPTHNRYTARSNTEMKKGIFTFGENLLIGRSQTVPMIGSPFIDLCRMPPIIPVYDANMPGGYGTGSSAYQTYGTNPIGLQETRNNTQTSNRLIGNAFLQIEPIKGLKLKSSLGIEYHNWFDRNITEYKQIRYLDVSNYENEQVEYRGDFGTWIWENTAFYEKTINKHSFDVLAGYTTQEAISKSNQAGAKNLVPGYWSLSPGLTEPSVDGNDEEFALTSFLARINYAYAGKYLLQANYRYDGSSKFGPNYLHGNFPSISVGWRISEENFSKFMKPAVDDLKLRVSYGKIGDQEAVDPYKYDTFIITGEGAIFGPNQKYYPGAIQKGRANPDIRWESKTTFNVGMDVAMFEQRLYGSFEYFDAVSDGLLLEVPMSWSMGTDIPPWDNYGKLNNHGVELTVGFRETKKEFNYNVSFNLTTVKTKVLVLDKSRHEAGLSGVNCSEVGRSVGDFFVVRTDGIFQSWDEVYAHTATIHDEATGTDRTVMIQPNAHPGDIRYKDLNGDGMISKGDREYVGSPFADVEMGLNFSASYKNFDFNLFLTGVAGNKIYNNTKYWLERMDETTNYPKDLRPWTESNPSTTTPRPVMGPNDNTLPYSDRWIEDGDYIRLKNIQLGYTIPAHLLQSTKVFEYARIYTGAQNLLTLTNYSGFDPEISGGSIFGKGNDDGHFPPVRTFVVGLQVSF